MPSDRSAVIDLRLQAGDAVAVVIDPELGLGLATEAGSRYSDGNPFDAMADLDLRFGPRWVWWDRATADQVVAGGLSLDRCWDVLTVHRLLHGGWRTSIAEAWAWLNRLPLETLPKMGQLGLLDAPADEGIDPENPLRPDGHLRPEWVGGSWRTSPERLAAWAAVAWQAAQLQQRLLAERPHPDRALSTARSESAAELLCAELARDGLPIDEAEALRIIGEVAGPRPDNMADSDAERERRDGIVLARLSGSEEVNRRQINLRNPGQVKAMLRREGIDVADTRAWRLEQLRDDHPVIDALLKWRKDERIATTYGYRWMDEHVAGGRLRGQWTGSDGAAGRMTASAGLHNLPADMRSAVAADADHVFVRADLGQIEPRVLAAVSGDRALIAATADDDLYQPIARRLGVARDVAKVAVLGAMYGATTGESAHALPGLRQNYPVAMGLLEQAADDGRRGTDILTIGGRRVRMGGPAPSADSTGDGRTTEESSAGRLDRARSAAESRGRYARNALIQGAAAEFFKVWAIIVRRRAREFDANVVLCLHDELLVHAPEHHGAEVAALVDAAVTEAAHYWSPEPDVRFVAEVGIIRRWSEAKD